ARENQPMRTVALPVSMAVVAIIAGTIAFWPKARGQVSEVPSVEDVFALFDPQYPGRGPDSVRKESHDHAMAYGLFASAAAMAGKSGEAQVAADWLVSNSQPKPNAVGWGLPYAWDAFGDESTNPE